MSNPTRLALVMLMAAAAPVVAVNAAPQYPAARGDRISPGFEQGYSRGVNAGDEDARRREEFGFFDENDYRRGDLGYRREYGQLDAYRTEFRRGFSVGYRVGFERRSPQGWDDGRGWNTGRGDSGRGSTNGPGWNNGRGSNTGRGWDNGRGRGRAGGPVYRRDLARDFGFADGFSAGVEDARRRRAYDPFGEGRYRSGDRGYERDYGSRDVYRLNYRDAFRRGYDDGYREVLRAW